MTFEELKARLNDYAYELPGEDSQLRMAPLSRGRYPMDENVIAAATRSAVLVLLYPKGNAAHTILIKRNEYAGVHSAQVSFPGGRHEEEDADLSVTAVREAEEEIGIDRSQLHVISQLTHLYIPPSRYLVYPFLATADKRPEFTPDPKEVQAIMELNLDQLLDDSISKSKQMPLSSGLLTDVPYFDIHGHVVWGATAMILSELKELLRQLR